MKYITPNVDRVLNEHGYIKFEDYPIYIRKMEDPIGEYQYNVVFCVEQEHVKVVEDYFDQWTEKEFITAVGTLPATMSHNLLKTLKYDDLLMLVADCYWHNGDDDLHNKTIELHDKVSIHKYK